MFTEIIENDTMNDLKGIKDYDEALETLRNASLES